VEEEVQQPGAADEAADATVPSGTTESIPEETVASAAEAEEEPLAKAERERDEYLDLAQRTRAELENYRKRAAREAAQAGERAKANLIRELLPVLDNLERASHRPVKTSSISPTA
jgi:molecular chaperone GrpE